MQERQQQILDHIRVNQPALIADMIKDLEICRSRYYRETMELREQGQPVAIPGVGVLSGRRVGIIAGEKSVARGRADKNHCTGVCMKPLLRYIIGRARLIAPGRSVQPRRKKGEA